MESLRGQVAIVTGAARGVGLGIATVLRDEGADVVLADLDERGARLAATQLSSTGEHAIGVGVGVRPSQISQAMRITAQPKRRCLV